MARSSLKEMDRIFLAIIAGSVIALVAAFALIRAPADPNVSAETALSHDDSRKRSKWISNMWIRNRWTTRSRSPCPVERMPSPPLGPTLCRCCFGRSGPESDGARRAYEPALHKVVIDTSLSGPCGRPRNGPGASKAKSARAAAPPREGFIGGFMDNESARHASFLNCQESARLAAGRWYFWFSSVFWIR